MAFNSDTVMFYKTFRDYGVFDEKGSTFLSMRKVQWYKEGNEPDESKAKIELRKWVVTPEGERANKGISFLTEDGPDNLTKLLIDNGFGKTKEVLRSIMKREDFRESVERINDDDIDSDPNSEYFDMRDILLNTAIEEDE